MPHHLNGHRVEHWTVAELIKEVWSDPHILPLPKLHDNGVLIAGWLLHRQLPKTAIYGHALLVLHGIATCPLTFTFVCSQHANV